MSEKEIVFLFVTILPNPFFDKLAGSDTKNFPDIVAFGEMIENAVKNKKIQVNDVPIMEKRKIF